MIRACRHSALPELVQQNERPFRGVAKSERYLIEVDHKGGLNLACREPVKLPRTEAERERITLETDSRVCTRVKTSTDVSYNSALARGDALLLSTTPSVADAAGTKLERVSALLVVLQLEVTIQSAPCTESKRLV